ncbi:hypothetical protein F6B41_00170 [Microbacterium lushaniae]|nr:hypothetical protein F6B41_00765 [Microbacterium lushaniae]KAA9159857.1 hypothetical protein F6B41_00170 [Microbacterium lushaniae]
MTPESRRRGRLVAATAVAASASLILTACAGGDSGDTSGGDSAGSQVIVSQWSPPSTFNVLTAADQYAYEDIALMFASLTVLDTEYNVLPELAESWDASEDATQFTFHLDPDATWHDGEPLTASDVKFTFETMANPEIAASSFSTFAGIVGMDEVKDGSATEVSGIEAVDDHTVTFTLEAADVTFPAKVARSTSRTTGIIPEHLLADVAPAAFADDAFWDSPIGSGPYKFVQYKDGQYLELEAFDDYVLGAPKIEKVFMRIGTQPVLVAQLQSGEVDFASLAATDVAGVEAVGGISVSEQPSVTWQAVYPNQTKPYLQDPRVRQALYQAIDRQGLVDSLLQGHGEVVRSPISTPEWAVNPDVREYPYDPAAAKKLLVEAGWDADQVLQIRLGTGNAIRDAEAPILQQAFAEIGVKSEIVATDFPTLLEDMQTGDFDLALVGHQSGYDPDYTAIWSATASHPPAGNNFPRYSNPEVDALLEQGRAELDQDARKEIYDQYQEILVEDAAMLWLFRANDIYGISDRISGFDPAPGQFALWNIHEWEVVE